MSKTDISTLFLRCLDAHPAADAMEVASLLWLADHAEERAMDGVALDDLKTTEKARLAADPAFLVAVADAALEELGGFPFGDVLARESVTDAVDDAVAAEARLRGLDA